MVAGLFFSASTFAAEKEMRQVTFSVIGLGSQPFPEDCLYLSNDQVLRIGEIAPNYRTKPFTYAGPPLFRLYRKQPDGSMAVYAEAMIPDGVSEPLFILIPDRDKDGARLLVFDDGPSGFPPGAYRFVNTTPHRMAGMLAEEKFLLDPGKSIIVRPGVEPNTYFGVDLRSEQNNVWNPGYSSRWRHRAKTRLVMFLYTDPDNPTAIRSQTIPQHL